MAANGAVKLVIAMRAKRPLAFLLVAVMAVSMLAAAPGTVVAQDNDTNEGGNCTAVSSSDVDQDQDSLLTGVNVQDQDGSSGSAAVIDNEQENEQEIDQENDQDGDASTLVGDSVVVQDSEQVGVNSNSQSQCEANQDA